MIMELYGFSGFMKSKSHELVAAPAVREECSRHRNNSMGMGVIFSVEFIVNHLINTGGGYFISRLKFIHLSCVGYLLLESEVEDLLTANGRLLINRSE